MPLCLQYSSTTRYSIPTTIPAVGLQLIDDRKVAEELISMKPDVELSIRQLRSREEPHQSDADRTQRDHHTHLNSWIDINRVEQRRTVPVYSSSHTNTEVSNRYRSIAIG